MAREHQGLDRFSADGMAGPDSPALLQLSRDGGSRHDLHRRDGSRIAAALARKVVRLPVDVVDADGLRAVAVYRQHGGMDDRGTRTPALAHLWIDAHRPGHLSARGRRQCLVHADWLHGDVRGAVDPLAVPYLSRD